MVWDNAIYKHTCQNTASHIFPIRFDACTSPCKLPSIITAFPFFLRSSSGPGSLFDSLHVNSRAEPSRLTQRNRKGGLWVCGSFQRRRKQTRHKQWREKQKERKEPLQMVAGKEECRVREEPSWEGYFRCRHARVHAGSCEHAVSLSVTIRAALLCGAPGKRGRYARWDNNKRCSNALRTPNSVRTARARRCRRFSLFFLFPSRWPLRKTGSVSSRHTNGWNAPVDVTQSRRARHRSRSHSWTVAETHRGFRKCDGNAPRPKSCHK